MKNWLCEIRKVGIWDWLWFVVWLGRNEFSPKLDLERYYPHDLDQMVKDRDKACKLDEQLS